MPAILKKIHFVTSIPSPYQVDFFNALENLIPGEFTVTFSAAQEADRQYYKVPDEFSFSAEILNYSIRCVGKDYHWNGGLANALRERPATNYVLGGNYFMPDARAARRHCKRSKSRWFFWGENPFKKTEGGIKRWVKECYLRWFLQSATGVIGIGKAGAEAYARLSGMCPHINIPYAPNLIPLARPSEALLAKAKSFRAERIKGDDVLVLYVGSLIERKDPATLIRSFAQVAERVPATRLLIVGEGSLRRGLQLQVEDLQLGRQVEFVGFLQGDDLYAAYLAADVFVLPTLGHEGWGVVVQEAMAAGLPLVASSRVGAARDMVTEDDAGYLFEGGDQQGLFETLIRLIEKPEQRKTMGEVARKRAKNTDSKVAARRLIEFLDLIK